MRRALAAAAVAAPVLFAVDAGAAPPRIRLADVPCAGCRASLPASDAPAPLLVVLHGDWGKGPGDVLEGWERQAAARGVGVLALACPRELGCDGSFWRWDGDPSWVVAEVDALASRHPIDRERLWIAGWSGGASWIGLRTQAFEARFAAIVHHGGGIPPRESDCGARRAPVYFLVGRRNPLHDLAIRLRDHYEACPREIVWRALPNADHSGEWAALYANAGAILDWLADKRLPAEAPRAEAPRADAGPPAHARSPGLADAPSDAGAPPRASVVAPRAGCRCDVAPDRAPPPPWVALAACALALRRRCGRANTVLRGAVLPGGRERA